MNQEQPMRIRFFHAYPHQYAGVQRITHVLALHLRERGYDVGVVVPDEGPFEVRLREDGIPVAVVRVPRIWTRYGGTLRGPAGLLAIAALPVYWLRLARALRHDQPSLLHCNDHRGVLLAGVPARLARVPLVWHVHGTYASDALNALGGVLARSILVVSHATYEEMPILARFSTKVTVLHSGLPPLSAGAAEETGAPLVACGARIHPEKGLDVLVRASALLRPRHPDLRVCVAGIAQEGYERHHEELEALAYELGVAHLVRFLGHVPDAISLWAAADVYVQPSRAEPFGLGVLEAMALGTPVVASRVGGLAELVEDGVSGLLVPPDDPVALADAIDRVCTDERLRAGLIAAGRERATTEFPLDRMIERLLDVYRSAGAPEPIRDPTHA